MSEQTLDLDPAEVEAWVQYYHSGFFLPQAWRVYLYEMENKMRCFHPDDRWEIPYRIAALRQLINQLPPEISDQ